MLLHELAHVEARQGGFIVEEELGEGLGELRFADAGGPQEEERPDGPARVAQPDPATTHGAAHGAHRLVLPDHPLLEAVLHGQELVGLLLEHLRHGHARPDGDDPRHVLGHHRVVHHRVAVLAQRALRRFELLVEQGHAPEAQLASASVVLGGARLLELALGRGLLPLEPPHLADEPQLLLPARPHLVDAWTQVLGLRLEPLAGLHRLGVVVVLEGHALDLDRLEMPLERIELGRHAFHLDADVRRSLVHQVDGALRKLHARDVASREVGGGDQGRVGDAHAVVDLEAPHDAAKHGDGLVDGRRLHRDGYETSREGAVRIEGLAHLIGCRDADGPHLAASEGRREQAARTRGGGAVAHQRAQVRQEEDDLAGRVPHRVEHAAHALLELSPELGAGHEGAHVEGDEALAREHLGHVAARDALREPLDDGRLADAGLAHEQRVVLAPPRQHLEYPAQLRVAPHRRVELALGGEARQVPAELLDGIALVGARCGAWRCSSARAASRAAASRSLLVVSRHRRAVDGRAQDGGAQTALAHDRLDGAVGLLGAGQ